MCRIPSHHGIIRASDYSVKNVFAAYQHVHTKILLISTVLYIYILYTYCTYKIRISLCAHRLESIPIMRPHLGLLRSSSWCTIRREFGRSLLGCTRPGKRRRDLHNRIHTPEFLQLTDGESLRNGIGGTCSGAGTRNGALRCAFRRFRCFMEASQVPVMPVAVTDAILNFFKPLWPYQLILWLRLNLWPPVQRICHAGLR